MLHHVVQDSPHIWLNDLGRVVEILVLAELAQKNLLVQLIQKKVVLAEKQLPHWFSLVDFSFQKFGTSMQLDNNHKINQEEVGKNSTDLFLMARYLKAIGMKNSQWPSFVLMPSNRMGPDAIKICVFWKEKNSSSNQFFQALPPTEDFDKYQQYFIFVSFGFKLSSQNISSQQKQNNLDSTNPYNFFHSAKHLKEEFLQIFPQSSWLGSVQILVEIESKSFECDVKENQLVVRVGLKDLDSTGLDFTQKTLSLLNNAVQMFKKNSSLEPNN